MSVEKQEKNLFFYSYIFLLKNIEIVFFLPLHTLSLTGENYDIKTLRFLIAVGLKIKVLNIHLK